MAKKNKNFYGSMIFGNCLGMVIFLVAAVLGGLYWIDSYTLHGVGVEMPDLKGQNANVAIKKLEAMGLRGEVSDTGYVENVDGGAVLDQSITAGVKVKPGRWISLVVNSTEVRKVALPADIAGNCSLREAEMKLQARGFRIGPPEYILGDKNWVYEMKVAGRVVSAGTMIPVKTPITLVVGDGEVEEEYSGGDSFYEEAFSDTSIVGSGAQKADDADLFE